MNFIREPGWRYDSYHYLDDEKSEYICKKCAPTQKDAYKYFNNTLEVGFRP